MHIPEGKDHITSIIRFLRSLNVNFFFSVKYCSIHKRLNFISLKWMNLLWCKYLDSSSHYQREIFEHLWSFALTRRPDFIGLNVWRSFCCDVYIYLPHLTRSAFCIKLSNIVRKQNCQYLSTDIDFLSSCLNTCCIFHTQRITNVCLAPYYSTFWVMVYL